MLLSPLQVVEDEPDPSDPEFSVWFMDKQIRHEATWKKVAKQVAEDRQLAAVLQQEEQLPELTSASTPNQVSRSLTQSVPTRSPSLFLLAHSVCSYSLTQSVPTRSPRDTVLGKRATCPQIGFAVITSC